MPKQVKNAKESTTVDTKPYPTSTRRRAKKMRAENSNPQKTKEPRPSEVVEEEVSETESSIPIEQPTPKKKATGGTGKKVKVFATKDSMLSLIDLVASKEVERSQGKLKRRAEIEDKVEQREHAALQVKTKKQDKLEMVKEQIKNKRRIQKREKKRTQKQSHQSSAQKCLNISPERRKVNGTLHHKLGECGFREQKGNGKLQPLITPPQPAFYKKGDRARIAQFISLSPSNTFKIKMPAAVHVTLPPPSPPPHYNYTYSYSYNSYGLSVAVAYAYSYQFPSLMPPPPSPVGAKGKGKGKGKAKSK
ncbi:unnamed protein product [Umbelopsis vinacea]